MKNKFTTSSIYKEAGWWDEAKGWAGDVADATEAAFGDGLNYAAAAEAVEEGVTDWVTAPVDAGKKALDGDFSGAALEMGEGAVSAVQAAMSPGWASAQQGYDAIDNYNASRENNADDGSVNPYGPSSPDARGWERMMDAGRATIGMFTGVPRERRQEGMAQWDRHREQRQADKEFEKLQEYHEVNQPRVIEWDPQAEEEEAYRQHLEAQRDTYEGGVVPWEDMKGARENNADDVVFVEEVEVPLPLDSGDITGLEEMVESMFDESSLEVQEVDLLKAHPGHDLTAEDVLKNISETLDEAGELSDDFAELAKSLPGSDMALDELDDKEEPKETNYTDDGDLSKFLDYVMEIYPANIPQHDGRSMLGCERAISWLDRLNSEISKNIRLDTDNILNIHELENIRVNIMSDVLALKGHLGKLKKKFKEDNVKTAAINSKGIPTWTGPAGEQVEYDDLVKEAASTPRKMVIAVSPFERAIAGIMINSHVSAGHSMEDVYGFLSEKYAIEPREELAIMQVCMDSGFPIFKDRGMLSGDKDSEDMRRGADFIKSYFN